MAVARRRPVVSPPRPGSVGGGRFVTRETVVGSRAFRGDVNISDADDGINPRISGARIVIVAQDGEGHHASSALRHGSRGIRQGVPRNSRIALLLRVARMRVDHKSLRGSLLIAVPVV